MELTSKQRQYLKREAHHRKAIVMVGDSGVSESVIKKTGVELENHELIKVKFIDGAPEKAREAGPKLASSTGAILVQVIGGVAVLYRKRTKKPTLVLPTS